MSRAPGAGAAPGIGASRQNGEAAPSLACRFLPGRQPLRRSRRVGHRVRTRIGKGRVTAAGKRRTNALPGEGGVKVCRCVVRWPARGDGGHVATAMEKRGRRRRPQPTAAAASARLHQGGIRERDERHPPADARRNAALHGCPGVGRGSASTSAPPVGRALRVTSE